MSSPPPALPDEDYEAIEAAVMDTARGRWFLAEFARRNRSADTGVLLAAIERLENLLAVAGPDVPAPHTPVVTELATSASTELFAIESPMAATSIPSAGLPDDGASTWVIDDPRPPEQPQSAPEIVEIDDVEMLWRPFERVDDLGEHDSDAGDVVFASSEPSSQGIVLSAALAAAQETIARATEAPPPPPPASHSPEPVAPATLDALSFDEKIVYFA